MKGCESSNAPVYTSHHKEGRKAGSDADLVLRNNSPILSIGTAATLFQTNS